MGDFATRAEDPKRTSGSLQAHSGILQAKICIPLMGHFQLSRHFLEKRNFVNYAGHSARGMLILSARKKAKVFYYLRKRFRILISKENACM